MTFHSRYLNGEHKQVYDEITALGMVAFSPDYLADVEQVLNTTFERVRFNLKVIYDTLAESGYQFKTEFLYNFERPLHEPLPDTSVLLSTLTETVSQFGYIPLSLQYFYKIVGGVNFAWDYNTNENILWEMADPIQICSLDAVIDSLVDEDWIEEQKDRLFLGTDYPSLILSADIYHKDNISGGPPYELQITREPSIDGLFLNESHDTSFINYLRICFEFCGFPGIEVGASKNFDSFCKRVKPLLKPI